MRRGRWVPYWSARQRAVLFGRYRHLYGLLYQGKGDCGIVDFDHKASKVIVLQCDRYGLIGVMDIPEHSVTVVMKDSGAQDARHMGAAEANAFQPRMRLILRQGGANHMRQRDIQPALQCPEPVDTGYMDDKHLGRDLDLCHGMQCSFR